MKQNTRYGPEQTKINPGHCPICGSPICTNINFVCSEECIYAEKKTMDRIVGCLQNGMHTSCHCDYPALIEAYHIRVYKRDNFETIHHFLTHPTLPPPFLTDDLFDI